MSSDAPRSKRRRTVFTAADVVRKFCARQDDVDLHATQPDCTIVTKLGDFPVSLPTSIFGSLLCMKAKY